MPELPEVETIARMLRQGLPQRGGQLLGRRILRARVGWARTVAAPSAAAFLRRIKGQRIIEIGRRGKLVRIDLDRDTLLIHLRMSGDLLLGFAKRPIGSHSRLELYFDNGLQLSFNDPRKFGRVWLVADPGDLFSALGPEPLDPSSPRSGSLGTSPALTSALFHKMLAARKRQLKPLL
ncbi:MAG: DNA-formamidopyrimidine glycosylase family protein, partial [Anaerolineales bacterium]